MRRRWHPRTLAGPRAHTLHCPAPLACCSKNVTFGVSDVLELVNLVETGAAAAYEVGSAGARTSTQQGAVVRPSRCGAT